MQQRRDEAAALLTDVVTDLTSIGTDLEVELRRYSYACELAGLRSEAEWAWSELGGYASRQEAPEYRRATAILRWQPDLNAATYRRIEAASHAAVYGGPGPDERSAEVLFVGVPELIQATTTGFREFTGETETIPSRRYNSPNYQFQRIRVVEPAHVTATLGRIERVLLGRAIANRIALVYGSAVEEVWSKLRSDLEPRLLKTGLSDHLETIERELSNGTAAGRQAAMYGCRSLLTGLTDHLWRDERPTYSPLAGDGPDGKLAVTQNRSKNRLAAYLHQSIGGRTAEDYLQAEIDRLWRSITKLIDLANKAHDADVSQEDAELAVIGTYLLVGELGRRTNFVPVEHYSG